MTVRSDLPHTEADLVEWAWTIICNAGGGATYDGTVGWHNEAPDWQRAAANFRTAYHALLSEQFG